MRALRAVGILLTLILVAGYGRAAEVPRLLADINQTPPSPLGNTVAQPTGFFRLGDRMLFSTTSRENGDEGILWSTDGTVSGTRVVSSTLCPFPCQGIRSLGTWHGLAILAVATGPEYGFDSQLWRTDGTPAGTFPLTEPIRYDPFGNQTTIYAVGDRFFFMVCGFPDGCELFRSDGTRAGTAPFAAAGSFFDPHSFTFWRDRLVFVAYDDEFSRGLWSTDGTAEGTVRLADVGEYYSVEAPVVPTPSRLFFGSGGTGEDLWVTDGTPDSARRLADLESISCPPTDHECDFPDVTTLTAAGDEVLFTTRRPGHGKEIWRSDGTESGTRPVLELPSGADLRAMPERLPAGRWLFPLSLAGQAATLWTADGDFSHLAPLTGCEGGACPVFQTYLSPALPWLFAGEDTAHGTEIWITDGTAEGTRRLADACPGPCSGYRFQPGVATVLGGGAGKTWFHAFSSAADDGTNDELWVTDGTPGGTQRVIGHVESGLGFLGDLTFFGLGGENRDASELWVTDGTPAGTRQAAVLQRLAPGSDPQFLPRDNGVLLQAFDGTRSALWRSDGTPGGITLLAELSADRSFGQGFTQVGDLQFFQVGREDATEIWRTDGTAAGTRQVARVNPVVALETSWHGKLLFQVEGLKTCAFWSSDGTAGGTREILPALPGRRCPTAVQAFGGKLLFVARVQKERGFVPQIFLSDGTPAGTRQISQIRGSRAPLDDRHPAMVGGITFFRINARGASASGTEIWRTDGTGAGTYRVFGNLLQPSSLFGFQGSLYFTARPATGAPAGLYRAPAAGGDPVLLTGIVLSSQPEPLEFTPVGDRLFFVARDLEAGSELWVTDGTPAGTHRVRDVHPGPGSSHPGSLVAAGDRIFFAAEDGEHGRELWESDGTEAGTRLVWDLNPGGFSSSPTNLTVSGGSLFFSADDGETGAEPWVMRLERGCLGNG